MENYNQEITIRSMEEADYEKVFGLWKTIKGFGIRSVDDSKEGVIRFIRRNPGISVVAEANGQVVGAILCGHDGRRGCLYHVCVHRDCRMRGIGKAMVVFAMNAFHLALVQYFLTHASIPPFCNLSYAPLYVGSM